MQPDQIIGQLLGTLVGRKRSRRSGLMGMAMGRRGRRSSLLTGGTLLTAAGLVWGALESMQKSTVPQGAPGGAPPQPPPPPRPPGSPGASRGVMGGAGAAQTPPVVPPPLPPAAGQAPVPPPLPTATGGATGGAATPQPGGAQAPDAPGEVAGLMPLLHLAISAARADGELSAEEASLIRDRAAELGVAADVDRALGERPSLESITAAFTTDDQRQAAYALAFGVIHGDGVVAPGERMYLTQLGRLLRLPPDDIETIERDTLGEE